MRKSYSSLNILHKRLSGVMESNGLFSSLFSSRKYLTVTIPYYDYIRARVFINDLRDNFADKIPYQFDVAILLHMLYDDFLSQIKRGVAENEQIANYLIEGKKKHFQSTTIQKRIMKPLTPHILEFETVEEELGCNKAQEERTAYITLRMRETEILRAEVLLNDLIPYTNEIEVSVEQLIAIVYLDFIQSVKDEGNSLKVQKSILNHIKNS